MAAPVILQHYDLGGVGPVLILLHANGFVGMTLAPVAHELRNSFRCIALDHYGHGASPQPPAGRAVTAELMAQAVLDTVTALGLTGCYCFGHSSGGTFALLLATGPRSPFVALYCYEAVAVAKLPTTPPTRNVLAGMALRRRDRWPSADEARSSLVIKPPFSGLMAEALDAYIRFGMRPARAAGASGASDAFAGVELCCTCETEAALYEALNPGVRPHDWSLVSCPVVVALGTASGLHGDLTAAGPGLVAALPHSRLHRFDGLSHFGPLEDPKAVARHVAACFAELAATGRVAPASRL